MAYAQVHIWLGHVPERVALLGLEARAVPPPQRRASPALLSVRNGAEDAHGQAVNCRVAMGGGEPAHGARAGVDA